MKERGILFSAPMVRAILAGTKTVTRRIVKPQQPKLSTMEPYELELTERDGAITAYTREQFANRCPYGAPGHRLWVKESIRLVERRHPHGPDRDTALFVADGEVTMLDTWPWKREALPGMFLPRGLSRIALDVVSVRVERLHDITEQDARAEGVERYDDDGVTYYGPLNRGHAVARVAFGRLWKSINGAESWRANPWVWRVEFKRVERRP